MSSFKKVSSWTNDDSSSDGEEDGSKNLKSIKSDETDLIKNQQNDETTELSNNKSKSSGVISDKSSEYANKRDNFSRSKGKPQKIYNKDNYFKDNKFPKENKSYNPRPQSDNTKNESETIADVDLPQTRPKLELKPRSIPIDSTNILPKGNPSIFGSGKARDASLDIEVDYQIKNSVSDISIATENKTIVSTPESGPSDINNEKTSTSTIVNKRNPNFDSSHSRGSEGKKGKKTASIDEQSTKASNKVRPPTKTVNSQSFKEDSKDNASFNKSITTKSPNDNGLDKPKVIPKTQQSLSSNPFGALLDSDNDED